MVSAEGFRRLIDALSAIAVQACLPDGTILYWNRASEALYGYTAQEATGRDLVELIFPPEAREGVRATIGRGVETGEMPPPSMMVLRARGGRAVSVFAGHLMVRAPNGQPELFCFSIEQATLERAGESDRGERAMLRTMLEHLPGSVFVKDRQSRFTLCNPKVVRDLGVASMADVVGKSDFDFMEEETARGHFEEEQQVMRSGTPVIRKEETYFDSVLKQPGWYLTTKIPLRDDDGNVIGLLGVNSEISERRRAEEALRQSELFLKETQKIARLGGWKANPRTDYLEWTDGVYDIIEAPRDYKPGLAEGLTFFLPEYIPAISERIAACLASGEPFAIECQVTTRTGKKLWTEVRGLAPVTEGARTSVIGTFQDITERKQIEERLRQSEKMDAIGQLAGGVAHDFNNQLTGIMGYADLLVERLDDERLRRHAQNILVAARRAADLTGELLAFARKGKYQIAPVNLHAVIAEVVMLLERTIDKRVRIRQDLHANPHVVMGDLSQLQNAILNLALNARDAMPGGGELVLCTEVVKLDESRCRQDGIGLTPGLYLELSVADNGVGMDLETQKHLYEPFFTTKPPGKGTGMGLAAVYGTVRNHRGMIRAESAPGEGTTFRIWLPLAEMSERAEEKPAPAVPQTKGVRILVVDDEEVVRTIAAEILRSQGHEVTVCSDGAEALKVYEKFHAEIDLVLLDMVMPKLGGRDLFRALRQINPAVKALLSSGFSLDGEAQAILDEGVLGFIQKPYQVDELSKAVSDTLRA